MTTKGDDMYRDALLTGRACFAALILLFCILAGFDVEAGELVVALSSEALREARCAVLDGAFVLQELETARLRLAGGPPQPMVSSHCKAGVKGNVLPDGAPNLSLLYRFEVPRSTNLLDAAYKLGKLPGVEWAEALHDIPYVEDVPVYYGDELPPPEPELGLESSDGYVVPNDPLFPNQKSLMQTHFPEAWSISTGSTQVVICSIDGGYTDSHEDLMGSMWDNPEEANGPNNSNGYLGDIHGWNFSANTPYVYDSFHPGAGHGVPCTSVYSARGNNGIGMTGMLWDATVMITIRDWNDTALDGVKSAVYAADNGARIAHMGAGGPHSYSKTGKSMIQYARSKGLLIYAAAGNDRVFMPRFPAGYREVVAVAGVDGNDVPLGTNYGYWTGASAPLDILNCVTCTSEGGYGWGSGTSIANPYAAGVAALTLSVHQDWDPDLLQAHVRATATPTNPQDENVAGEHNAFEVGPRVDAYAALSTAPRVEFSPQFWLLRPHGSSHSGANRFDLVLALENTWKEATSVHLHLESNDPMVSVTGDPVLLGDMRPLEVVCGALPHEITVADECPENYGTALHAIVTFGDVYEQQDLTLTVVLNRGTTALYGWPSQELDPHLYPPMRADLNGDGLPEVLCPTSVACHVFSVGGEKIDEIPVVSGSNGPAVADLDGDLADEIIFLDPFHRLRVFDQELGILELTDESVWAALYPHYGLCRGHVTIANLCGNSGRQILVKTSNPDDPSGSPVLAALNMDGSYVDAFPLDYFVQSRNFAAADLDGDGIDEIIFLASGAFYVVDARGQVLPGWPFKIDQYSFDPEGPSAMVSAGDLDGDGTPEILGTLGERLVFAFRIDGSLIPGWPFASGNAVFETHPVLADVNGDGGCEVVLVEMAPPHDVQFQRDGGIIHVINYMGQELPGWPVDTGIHYLQPPVACDLNGDGKQNVLITSSRGVYASDEAGRVLPGWPIIVAPRALGIYSYSQASIDDFDDDGTLDIGIPMEGRYFIFRLDGVPKGAAQWGYKGGSPDMRYSPVGVPRLPSITILPKQRSLYAGMDTLSADIRMANPGEERIVVASAWVEALGQKFHLPGFSADEHAFTLALSGHCVIELPEMVNIPIPVDVPAMDLVIAGQLLDASTATVLSSPSETVHIENYVAPTGTIIVEGMVGASWQTFSFMLGTSTLEATHLWYFDDGATSSLLSPGHLFRTPGEHIVGLVLTDGRDGQFLATASAIVAEQAGSCPDDMANMGSFCIDLFEASRPDATAFDFGAEPGAAMSVQGVLPWQPSFAPQAHLACLMAGKRLCTEDEWRVACEGSFGSNRLVYPYGNEWRRYTCSDFYSWMDSITTTGKFSRCVSRVGVHDMVGNAWELVTDSQGLPISVLGGSTYGDPAYPDCRTTRDLEPEPWGRALAYGFRCCKDAQ
ncbi:MAG: VCBS repeat-containing protein [Candidatus Coatesbacteria bacterium]|nr:VCBS repeat-containing protein [Candidatus Coatesbacteria bacterium]